MFSLFILNLFISICSFCSKTVVDGHRLTFKTFTCGFTLLPIPPTFLLFFYKFFFETSSPNYCSINYSALLYSTRFKMHSNQFGITWFFSLSQELSPFLLNIIYKYKIFERAQVTPSSVFDIFLSSFSLLKRSHFFLLLNKFLRGSVLSCGTCKNCSNCLTLVPFALVWSMLPKSRILGDSTCMGIFFLFLKTWIVGVFSSILLVSMTFQFLFFHWTSSSFLQKLLLIQCTLFIVSPMCFFYFI